MNYPKLYRIGWPADKIERFLIVRSFQRSSRPKMFLLDLFDNIDTFPIRTDFIRYICRGWLGANYVLHQNKAPVMVNLERESG